MRILLTGAGGMVGRNLLEHPASKNYDILTPSREELNLLHRSSVDQYFSEKKPDAVIHAAGVVGGIQANIKNPVRFYTDNTLMGVNLISSARENGIVHLLNLGSSCMYPRNAQNPLTESMLLTGELEPTNEGYALAKLGVAKLCEYMSKEDGALYYRTAIPCNLYGRHDNFSLQTSHMIPAVLRRLIEARDHGADTVDIWGDGEARREFMYAADIADFVFFALPRLADMPSMLNVGMGVDYTINEYYQKIAEVVGYKGAFAHDLSKPVGMRQKLVDVTALSSFGWRYSTSLEAGLQHAYDFYQGANR